MQEHVREQIAALLRRLAFEIGRGSDVTDSDSVHDLRVAGRRLSMGLKLFDQFLPRTAVKRIRRNLKDLMRLASEVRNRDIALEFLVEAEVPAKSALVIALIKRREAYQARLRTALRRCKRRHTFREWRADLELQSR